MEYLRTYALGIASVLLLGAIVATQAVYDTERPHVPLQAPQPLPAHVLGVATLGLRSATASLLWLQLIQHIGGSGGMLDGVGASLEQMVALDPKFSYPYAFAVLLLPGTSAEATQQAVDLGTRGVKEDLHDWRIPYYLATTYHLVLKDTAKAALYMNVAANTPGVPDGIKVSAHNYGLRSDLREETKQIWVAIYENSADEVVRGQALQNIEHISVLQLLEEAVAAYKTRYGSYPADLEQLVQGRILRSLPEDPFGIHYTVTPEGKLVPKL